MKKCPFCGEEIQDEAIKCRFCGEFLEEKKPVHEEKPLEKPEEVEIDKKRTEPTVNQLIGLFLLFFLISLGVVFIILAFQPDNSFPYMSLGAIIVGILGLFLSIRIFKRRKRLAIKVLPFSICLILLGAVFFNGAYSEYKGYLNQVKQTRLEQEKKEAERQKLIKYNEEHKEEHYQTALALTKERKYQEALDMFSKVTSVDENYKDVKTQVENINNTLTKIREEEKIATAKRQISEAGKLMKSNNCGEIKQAIGLATLALQVLPDSKNAKKYLQEAKLNSLLCYEGNRQIKMIVRIRQNCPLKLYVGIKNDSNEVRHANPNHFTLVTVSGKSFSVSSETYGLGNYFDAVDLQPGTNTTGQLIFDTCDKPKKLVYQETIGTTISREFPFN